MTLKIKEDIVVETEHFYRPMETCPIGRKVQMKVIDGGVVFGVYTGKEKWALGWCGLPKEPPWMKALEKQMRFEFRSKQRDKQCGSKT